MIIGSYLAKFSNMKYLKGFYNWRGDGSHRNWSGSRSVGDVGDGFFEPSLLPNWDDLENRRGDDWENVRGVGTRGASAIAIQAK